MIKVIFTKSILFIHLAAFVFTLSSYAVHQLEHLNDIVCLTKDTQHYHAPAHQDSCKDLNFFTLQSFHAFAPYNLFVFKNPFLRINKIVFVTQKLITLFAPRSPPSLS